MRKYNKLEFMDPLTNLAIKYKTDKWGKKHHYTPVYYDLLKDRRESVKKVLEIGVAEGAGLRMFRDFFPNAMIYGAEIDENRLIKEERIETFRADQSILDHMIGLVEKTGRDIDLVVDDGSHLPEDQIATCLMLMSMLDKNVTYVIEDVADQTIVDSFGKYNVNFITAGKRYDDRLVIVRK